MNAAAVIITKSITMNAAAVTIITRNMITNPTATNIITKTARASFLW